MPPKVVGTREEQDWCCLTYLGGIDAINKRYNRGANAAEVRRYALKAGYTAGGHSVVEGQRRDSERPREAALGQRQRGGLLGEGPGREARGEPSCRRAVGGPRFQPHGHLDRNEMT